MFKNYLKVAFRNLWRHRAFSTINILGLSVGMSACLLIYLYVSFEFSYDRYHTNASRIFGVATNIKTPTDTLDWNSAPLAMTPAMKRDFPEVQAFCRIEPTDQLVRKDEKKFQEDNCAFADSSLFTFFSFPLIKGDPAKALTIPFSIVLSETTAKKYFGSADPLGQTLMITPNSFPTTVTGVMKDIPENSHFKYDFFISMSTFTQRFDPDADKQWGSFNGVAFVLLRNAQDAQGLRAKLPGFITRNTGDFLKKYQETYTLSLDPLKDIYFLNRSGTQHGGSRMNMYIFSLIAIFILLIASINFINLATARATERAREVGIRKVVGAGRVQLTGQFLGESILVCAIAFLIAVGLSVLLLPLFNQLSGKIISNGIFEHGNTTLTLLGIALAIGLFAGVYPALVLSGFRPIAVLKGKFASGKAGVHLRQSLVVTQFIISIALIAGTIVVYAQLRFMRSQDLGFKKDRLLVLDFARDSAIIHHYETFKQELVSLPNTLSASASGSLPGQAGSTAYTQFENRTGVMQPTDVDRYTVDYDFIKQYGLQIVAGRGLSRDFPSDSTHSIIVNQATVYTLGYDSPQKIIGKKFSQWGREGTIVGVVKNFHISSLRDLIKPMSISIDPFAFRYVTLHIGTADIPGTITAVANVWKKELPQRPFSYFFADESFDKQYRSDERFGQLFLYFAILAIFISCLGLFGLASYSTLQRTREIGIRKVLGSSVSGIITLLSKDFLRLVIIALVVATPIAWIFMNKWLRDFAYRIDMSWWIFALSGATALIIALVTVSFQAVRAARANPATSLRSE